jgi:GNAT superfamily N-acetyltransferase
MILSCQSPLLARVADRLTTETGVYSVDFDRVFTSLSPLETVYPGFREWYYGKVVPGIETGERLVVARVLGSDIQGVAIAKRGSEEKFCTLWVSQEARLAGVGGALAQEVFEWLGDARPLFTVPEERLMEFQGLLRQWDFGSGVPVRGYYGSDRVERVFNGTLSPSSAS